MDITFFLSCLYYFLPAYCANMTPPIARFAGVLKFLEIPVDNNQTFKGKRVLGANKTWRGLILGTLIGLLVFLLQKFLYDFSFFRAHSLIDYSNYPLIFGLLMPLGALLGDMFFSFIKRQIDLEPGASFMPWDQIDYVIGAFVLLYIFGFTLNLRSWLIILFSTIFLHIFVNKIGYYLKISRAEW